MRSISRIWLRTAWYSSKKIDHYGIRGHISLLLRSYFEVGKEMVHLNQAPTDRSNIGHDVAQKSLLSPLLFFLFIKDLPSYTLGQVVQYAGDTTLLCIVSNNRQLEKRGHAMLLEGNTWFASNKLLLKMKKRQSNYFLHLSAIKR